MRHLKEVETVAILGTVINKVQKATKAIYAALTTAISGLILVTIDGVPIGDVSTNQWLVIALAVLVAGGGVYGLSNKPS
jgi:hypothetical protein